MSAGLQTADRALQVLQQFRSQGEGLTVTEIATRLGIHRSTASRLVSTLAARGFLERDTVGSLLRLGPEVARIGRIALAGRELVAVARPVLNGLAAETGETVTLAVPIDGHVMTVAQADGSYFVSSGKWVGVRTPLHCAADGKVLLAFDGARVNSAGLIKRTKRTIVDPELLTRELDEGPPARLRGRRRRARRGAGGRCSAGPGGRVVHRGPLRVRTRVQVRREGRARTRAQVPCLRKGTGAVRRRPPISGGL